MVVNFGINGIAWLNEEQFISDYETLLTALEESSPDSVIIIESILPVSASKERSEPRMADGTLDRYNRAFKRTGSKAGPSLSELRIRTERRRREHGYADDSGDGLHFNSERLQRNSQSGFDPRGRGRKPLIPFVQGRLEDKLTGFSRPGFFPYTFSIRYPTPTWV